MENDESNRTIKVIDLSGGRIYTHRYSEFTSNVNTPTAISGQSYYDLEYTLNKWHDQNANYSISDVKGVVTLMNKGRGDLWQLKEAMDKELENPNKTKVVLEADNSFTVYEYDEKGNCISAYNYKEVKTDEKDSNSNAVWVTEISKKV